MTKVKIVLKVLLGGLLRGLLGVLVFVLGAIGFLFTFPAFKITFWLENGKPKKEVPQYGDN